MIDIKLIRETPEVVRENIRKKFQEEKLPLVDEILELDNDWRQIKKNLDNLRKERNDVSGLINSFIKENKNNEAKKLIERGKEIAKDIEEIEGEEKNLIEKIKTRMMDIPNIIDDSVPIGKDSSGNVEIEKIGVPFVPDFEIFNHAELLEKNQGADFTTAANVSGNGFYYLLDDFAVLHSAILAYARDFMIENGFKYCIPPFMIRGECVNGVMSFKERDAMMYKVEGENLFLIGTSEHSMISMFKDKIIRKNELPQTLTSYSPCFRKEVGSHGMEQKGVFRVHQFEKQEMIVICEPQDSFNWYERMLGLTVEFFRNLDVPVRKLECCSGDLADLKVKSADVEAWSPRQKKYFEVGSCSNLGEAQARRLGIKINGPNGNFFAHTLNNTVVASPRALIALMENNQNEDGTINIPKALRKYINGKKRIGKVIESSYHKPEIKIFVCERCNKEFSNKDEAIEHENKCKEMQKDKKGKKIFICEKCNKEFDDKDEAVKHERKCKGIQKDEKVRKIFVCEKCNKEFGDKDEAVKHEKKCRGDVPTKDL